MDWLDIIVRLGAAILIGGVIGLDRNLHHKPTGVRTLGLVAVGTALAVLAVAHDRQADVSRIVQGVGFIGAGVILRQATNGKVHGLTTAASIWVTAALGALCGLAAWKLLVVAVAGVLFLLLAGGSIEKWCQRALGIEEKADPPDSR